MKIKFLHDWNLSPSEAIEIQKQFRYEVETQDRFDFAVRAEISSAGNNTACR